MPKLPLSPTAVLGVVKEIRSVDDDLRPLLVAGAAEHAQAIVTALAEGAAPEALRDISGRPPSAYDLEGANVLVHAVDGPAPSEEDEKVFQLASRKGVGIVCVLFGAATGDPPPIPYVLDSSVIEVAPGETLPTETIAERIAEQAGETAHLLAARIPALREPVVQEIVKRFALQNGVLGVAIFIPGADFPVLTLNQIRMVLRIAAAHGEEIDGERALELLPVVGAGLGFRALAHNLVGFVPGLGWAVQGAIAFTGTRALGEAAIAYFDSGTPAKVKEYVRSRS
jgi:uncharacterized protein (DUF697 family)